MNTEILLKAVHPMIFFKILLGSALSFAILAVLGAYVCYLITFFSTPKRTSVKEKEYPLPDGADYEPFHPQMLEWIKQARALPSREVSITSFDGLTLRGRYFEFSPDAPIELMFHGYRSWGERDLSGGVARCRMLSHNALVVDQRGCNLSDGHSITFGILESRDCPVWVDYIVKEINPNAKILLTGISMGAATVMIASAKELPKNVVGVLADCGYTSAKEIIQKVMRDRHYPVKLLYPLVKLGAKLFGKFDPEETSPIECMKHCRLPVLFFHGDADDFVPHEMSIKNHGACIAQKRLVITPGAVHGLCFPVDQEGYVREMREFFEPIFKQSSEIL
jgi:pimeloyl-ACP methyl ester carboxylesterase